MLLAARSARGKYMAHLEEENEKKKEETRKRKAKDDQNINKNAQKGY